MGRWHPLYTGKCLSVDGHIIAEIHPSGWGGEWGFSACGAVGHKPTEDEAKAAAEAAIRAHARRLLELVGEEP